ADLSDESFVALLRVFSADKRAQAELVAARCMDVRGGPGSEWVEIRIKGGKGQGRAAGGPEVRARRGAERAVPWLRGQSPVNADWEKHLVGYVKLTGMKGAKDK